MKALLDPNHPVWRLLQMALSLAAFLVFVHHAHGEHVGLDSDDVFFAILGLKTATDARHFFLQEE